MIDIDISEVRSPLHLSVLEHRALHRLLTGTHKPRDKVVLAEAIERSIARQRFRMDAGRRLAALSIDNYPEPN